MIHKNEVGEVKLIINRGYGQIDLVRSIAKQLRDLGCRDIICEKAGKSASLMLKVPVIDVTKLFETYSREDLNKCFDAVTRLTEIGNMFVNIRDIMTD